MADTANLINATSNRPQVLVAAFLETPEDVVFECDANKSTVVATATLCNTDVSARTVELSVVKTGGTSADSNRVAVIDLDPDESCVVEEMVGLLLGPGDFISGVASAASAVSIVLTGAVSS